MSRMLTSSRKVGRLASLLRETWIGGKDSVQAFHEIDLGMEVELFGGQRQAGAHARYPSIERLCMDKR